MIYIHNIYGFDNFNEQGDKIIQQGIYIFGGMLSFVMINTHLLMIDQKVILSGNQAMVKMKAQNYYQKELLNIFENIEEAIFTTTSESDTIEISYQNFKFRNIIKKMKGVQSDKLFLEEN